MRTVAVLAMTVLAASSTQGPGWHAKPDVVARMTKARPASNFDERRVAPFELPDPLALPAGRVRTPEEWRPRRREILEHFRATVYGRRPGRPAVLRFDAVEEARAMDGAATLTRVAIHSRQDGRAHTFELRLFLPNGAGRPVPLFLLLNNRDPKVADVTRRHTSGFWPAEAAIARGYAIGVLQVADLAPDHRSRFRDGVISLFDGGAEPRPADAWRALAAWGWGASRAMDYVETDPRIDAARVALVGHSRGGKAALWAGAEDERFALLVSNESGEGGASLARRNFGETIEQITGAFPHWFVDAYRGYAGRARELPVDQHMLLALLAPRAVYVASADEDLWSDPRGEFLSLVHASPVYALWGDRPVTPDEMPPLDRPLVAGRRAYHVRSGGHDLTAFDWDRFMDFADALWPRR